MPYADPDKRRQASKDSMRRLRDRRKALITPIPIDPRGAEFRELREGVRDKITGALGVPASVLGVGPGEISKEGETDHGHGSS